MYEESRHLKKIDDGIFILLIFFKTNITALLKITIFRYIRITTYAFIISYEEFCLPIKKW